MKYLWTLALIVLSSPATGASQDTPYNIISIVTDDQAQWSLGIYGNRDSITPYMDQIGREGAVFTNAFAATPVCSPSRASFLTGRYGTQLGITDFISVAEGRRGVGLPLSAETWPEVLQANGYRTALIGKWHLGTTPEHHPTRHGFDDFVGFLAGSSKPMDATIEKDGREVPTSGPLADRLTDEALRFVEGNKARPFALLLHYREPHTPYVPVSESDAALFAGRPVTVPEQPGLVKEQIQQWTREYYASVHSVDRNIGRLLASLDRLDLSRRTIVIFTSDHGYMIGHHGLHTKGNAWWAAGGVVGPRRPNMFDDSLRIPLLVRWPGVVKPGTVIPDLVSNIDTFASMLAMTNVRAPRPPAESRDFTPLLKGIPIPPRNVVFAQFDMHNDALAYMRSIRTNEWKLVRHHYVEGIDELYHVSEDPGETVNLRNDERYKQVRQDLEAQLEAWQRSINDPVLSSHTPSHGPTEGSGRAYPNTPHP
jgi:arylsulfatase A-like enzyme